MITYENSAVKIGDFYILAESASISIQNPARGITKFGSPGYYSEVREGPAVGNVSVSYYLSDEDAGIRNLFTSDEVKLFNISVGPYTCYSGVANSMSMNIEPYSVVSCTLDMSFYNGYNDTDEGCSLPSIEVDAGDVKPWGGGGIGYKGIFSLTMPGPCPDTCWGVGDPVTITWAGATSPWSDGIEAEVQAITSTFSVCYFAFRWPESMGDAPPGHDITIGNNTPWRGSYIDAPPSGVMHGGTTEASTDLLWADDIASVNYRMEQSISPVYALGELVPSGYTREGGTIEVDLEGTGWGHIVDTGTICEGYTTGNIRLEALCGPCQDEVVYTADWRDQHGVDEWRNIGADPDAPPGSELRKWLIYSQVAGYGDEDFCRPCWGAGDNITITWPEWVTGVNPGEHPGPWRYGVDGFIKSVTGPPYCDFSFQMTGVTGTACYPGWGKKLADITVPPDSAGDPSGWSVYCDPSEGCEAPSENGVRVTLDGPPCPDKCWGDRHFVKLTWPDEDPPWSDGLTAQVRFTDSSLCESFIVWEGTLDPPAGAHLEITSLESPTQIVKPPYFPKSWAVPGGTKTWSGAFHDITVKNHDMSLKPRPYVIPFSGYVVNPSVALEPDSEIVGSLTVFDVF